MESYDVAVIGAGPGGYPAAIRAAQLGATVAIVEKEHLGGTCLNFGCIPTKALIASAETYMRIRHAEALGVVAKDVHADYAAMLAHKNRVVAQLKGGVKQLLTANGIKQFSGTASFRDRNTLAINGEAAINARKIIIATGSTSVMPTFLPKGPNVVESRGLLDLAALPQSMIVMGGGYIGCELACMAAALGVKVTVVELLHDILQLVDADARREVRTHMEKQLGMRILTGSALENIATERDGVHGRVGNETIFAELLLCAVGRKPVTEGLNLEAAGLKPNQSGFIEADEYCRTRAANIFAIGDVTGKVQLAHYATAQGITAAENALVAKPHKHETLVPNVIFTAPEIGTVGLGEDEAVRLGVPIRTGKFRFASLGKALAAGETAGFVKWVADAPTGRLLGATAVGPHATELIATATIAIRSEQTAGELGRTIMAHPTFSESWMEAAHAVEGASIHAPPRKRATV